MSSPDPPDNSAASPRRDASVTSDDEGDRRVEREGSPDEGRVDGEENTPAAASNGDQNDNAEQHVHKKKRVPRKKQKRTKASREAGKGKPPGTPNRFRGAQRELLMSFLEAYISIDKDRKGKNKRLADFWHAVRVAFWEGFTWQEARNGIGEGAEHFTEAETIEDTDEVSTSTRRSRHSG